MSSYLSSNERTTRSVSGCAWQVRMKPAATSCFSQREVALHAHLALEQLGAAGAAHARLAGERHLQAGRRGGVEHVALVRMEVDDALHAVADDGHLGVGGVAFAHRLHCLRARGIGDAEALDVDPLGRHAGGEQRRLGLVVDAVRAADEGMVDRGRIDQRAEKLADLLPADPPAMERQVGRFLGEHEVQRQARQVAVLQVLELLEEHGRAELAVAVDEREARPGLGGEHRLHDREDGRDAAAAGDAEVVALGIGRQRHEEAALRRHHLDDVAGLQGFVDPGREPSARHPADADAQLAVGDAGANRVGAALVAAADGVAQGQVLALGEAERVAQVSGHVERDDHRLVGVGADALHLERMEVEAGHGRLGLSDRLEVLERLAAGEAAPERLAGGGAEGGDPLGLEARAARAGQR
jgi:hypothetical protein